MRYTMLALALTFAVTTPALAVNWASLGMSADGITQQEWRQSPATDSTFADWDVNGDGVIKESEFSAHLFALTDVKSKGSISEHQWATSLEGIVPLKGAIGNIGVDWLYGAWYQAWDTNGNGVLSKGEFYAGLYGYYDADGSGAIASHEWEKARLASI